MKPLDCDPAASTPDDIRNDGTSSALSVAKGESDRAARGNAAPKDSRKVPRCVVVTAWIVRLCFAFVFVANVQCALGFVLAPEAYMGAYELSEVPGRVATQGIGVAFLMWNCTYPAVIWQPQRHHLLAGVVLAQQMVGLVGESVIRAMLPAGHELLASSIDLFIAFDATGLLLMGSSLAALLAAEKMHGKSRQAEQVERKGQLP